MSEEGVSWSYYDQFEETDDKYLPAHGEGETMATQIVTANCKLVYKWYNDGDVYDNTHYLKGWANDLSSFANWLRKYTHCADILDRIGQCRKESDYELLLKDLTDALYIPGYLEAMDQLPKQGSIYDCDGPFEYVEYCEEEEDEDYYEEEEEDY